MRQFCERQADACTIGSQAATALGHRAQAGAKMLYEFLNDQLGPADTGTAAIGAGKPVPTPAGRSSQHTLMPTDLAPTWRGPQPPAAIPALLHDIATRPDSARITPRFRRFLSPDLQDFYRAVANGDRQWSLAGCDDVTRRGISYLGSRIAYICHARAARRNGGGGGTLISVLYSSDWTAAGVEGYGY